MAIDVVVPPLGDGITRGTVVQWLKTVGSEVRRDETLLEVSTDKVDTEVHAPEAGLLIEQLYATGDPVEVGAVVARIGSPEEWAKIAPPVSPAQSLASQSIQSMLSSSINGSPPPLFDDEFEGAETLIRTPEPPTQPRVNSVEHAGARLGPVAVVSESNRDNELVDAASDMLDRYRVQIEKQRLQMKNPKRVREWAGAAVRRGVRVVIVCGGAGGHLAALVSAETRLPVIVVPRPGADGGFANLMGAVQAPGGVPLVAVCPGSRGARQAAAFAMRVLAAFDPAVHRMLGVEQLGDEDISFSRDPF